MFAVVKLRMSIQWHVGNAVKFKLDRTKIFSFAHFWCKEIAQPKGKVGAYGSIFGRNYKALTKR